MPIITPETSNDAAFFDRLRNAGAIVIDKQSAEHQDIRPARIGLLNLMPAAVMEETETRWLQLISQTVLQIEPVLIKFDDDCRERPDSKRRPILERYQPFSEVAEGGLDGLIITGDNQERRRDGSPLPLHELHYAKNLVDIIDWSDKNIPATIYSCLASHFALSHRYDIERKIGEQKVFGVYEHIVSSGSPITAQMDDVMRSPHSRWGSMNTVQLEQSGVAVLAQGDEAGWLIAEDKAESGGTNTYLQGHPEYWRYDLHAEFQRDQNELPDNYYPSDDPNQQPILSWSNDARTLLSSWIHNIYRNYSL